MSKKFSLIVLVCLPFSLLANEPESCTKLEEVQDKLKAIEAGLQDKETSEDEKKVHRTTKLNLIAQEDTLNRQCVREKKQQAANQKATEDVANKNAESGVPNGTICQPVFEAETREQDQSKKEILKAKKTYKECAVMRKFSASLNRKDQIESYSKKSVQKFSQDQKIQCDKPYSYTYDYDACLKALAHYNFIVNSEAFMNLQQTMRTDVKNANIAKDSQKAAAAGDSQTAMFDAAIESNKHQKNMQQEKAIAYSMAVAALTRAYHIIPGEEDAIEECKRLSQAEPALLKDCEGTIMKHKGDFLANQDNKASLFEAITQFTAKGLAAGIAMKNYNTAAQNIAKAKVPLQEEGNDMMIELCAANPMDPACVQRGNRVSGGGIISSGDFSLGDGGNNAFNMNPEDATFGEAGSATDLDDKNSVASINSPFADDAKKAKGILNPAGAAQAQASGGAQGGGGAGGGGGGLGGGGASLGSDLEGADTEGNKEAQIKAAQISGSYNTPGGGGYKGVSRGKEDSNPFASLFDQKSEGGVEEDRSIASGDVDGKASGLFEKISKRYGQIQADKRVEAKNLD